MSKSHASTSSLWRLLRLLLLPLILVGKLLDKHFVSFIRGRVLRGEDRVFSLRFVWYSDSVYLHPMIWGSLVLYLFASQVVVTDAKPLTEAAVPVAAAAEPDAASKAAPADGDGAESDEATPADGDGLPADTQSAATEQADDGAGSSGLSLGWLTMVWFLGLGVCYLTTMHNFNVLRAGILVICVCAMLGGSYFATHEFEINLVSGVIAHLDSLGATVTPGFYIVSAYFFAALIVCEVLWAWLFHRVEIDESYVYEFRFLMGTAREPIFARGLRRETKDLLELLLMGAADITHRTKNGVKRFPNVPFASLWLGLAFDKMLDYRRQGQIELEKRRQKDETDQARLQDAMEEISEDWQDDAGDTAEDVEPVDAG